MLARGSGANIWSRKIPPEFNDVVANEMRLSRSAAMLVAVLTVLSTPHAAHTRGAFTDDPDSMFNQQAILSGLNYRTEFTGVEDERMEKLLESASQLKTLQDRPPPSLIALERRIRSDVERLQTVLRS